MFKPTFVASLLVALLGGCAASTDSTGPSATDPNSNDPNVGQVGSGADGGAASDGATADGGSANADGGGGSAQANDSKVVAPVYLTNSTNWMETTTGLSAKALNEIYIPGTHDSGTYGIVSVYNRPVNDAFAPDGENPIVRAGQFVGLSDKWAKAQERTIQEQLEDGMRYLDLRPCREKSGNLRVCHSLYGPNMGDILDQIHTFATAHPKEIVIVEMSHFAGMSTPDHTNLQTLIQQRIGSNLLDASLGVGPSTKLGDVWSKQPGKSVLVVYDGASPPAFAVPENKTTTSWIETWDKQKKHDSFANAIQGMPTDTFFELSGQATPDSSGTLIERSIDPIGNYPTSLRALADETNPVVLGWIQSEWSTKRLNLIAVDFENRTCLYPLTLALNGVKNVSFAGCDIGKKTTWGDWHLAPYGRGAGTPLVCAAGQETIAGLCYTPCANGYSAVAGMPNVCGTNCPSGYTDTGLLCSRKGSIISADNSSCSKWDLCGLTVDKGCTTCPSGYHNDGCTCRIDPSTLTKSTYGRGVGTIPTSCTSGDEKDVALCYPKCRAGYDGVGPMCWPTN